MNINHTFLTIIVLFTACLSSCSSTNSSGGGQVINYPTVDEMARHESQWGMAPRQVQPRIRQAEPRDMIAPSAPAPSVQRSSPTPAPEPEPIKELPSQPTTPTDLSKVPQLR